MTGHHLREGDRGGADGNTPRAAAGETEDYNAQGFRAADMT